MFFLPYGSAPEFVLFSKRMIQRFFIIIDPSLFYLTLPRHEGAYLSSNQHRFLLGGSTITNLACIGQEIGEVLDRRGNVVYADFSRPFDTIDHSIKLIHLDLFHPLPSFLIHTWLIADAMSYTMDFFRTSFPALEFRKDPIWVLYC